MTKYIFVGYEYDDNGCVHDSIPYGRVLLAYDETEAIQKFLEELEENLNTLLIEENTIVRALDIYDDYIGLDVVIDYYSDIRLVMETLYSQQCLSGKDKYNKVSFKAKHMVKKDKIVLMLDEVQGKIKKLNKLIAKVKKNEYPPSEIHSLMYQATGKIISRAVEICC